LEYDMLQYAPSLVAASAIFLARYVQSPLQKPWDSTLRHYTQYQPSDLSECVKALHALVCECPNSSLPAIREKYSQHKQRSTTVLHQYQSLIFRMLAARRCRQKQQVASFFQRLNVLLDRCASSHVIKYLESKAAYATIVLLLQLQ
ncbi:cyclin A1,1, partial [Tanacetum coccineum]